MCTAILTEGIDFIVSLKESFKLAPCEVTTLGMPLAFLGTFNETFSHNSCISGSVGTQSRKQSNAREL